ncbi:MAG: hypothetical protein ACI9JL_003402 [Paracoccaceae bacterium]|jgi:hypothetical protein
MPTAMPALRSYTARAGFARSPAWRKFVDVQQSQGSAIAEEAIERIAELYGNEKRLRGKPPDERARIRQANAKPLLDDLEVWLGAQLRRISAKTPLGGASTTPSRASRGCGPISTTAFWNSTTTPPSAASPSDARTGFLPVSKAAASQPPSPIV